MGDLRGSGIACLRIRAVTAALAVALVAGGLSACGQTDEADKVDKSPQVVRLGALIPLSGANAPTGRRMVEAFQMAIKEANDAGGVLGHQVELVTGDDACDPGTAVMRANELVDKDITVSVGGACSQATVPALKVFREAGVPMIIPVSNSTDLLAPRYDSVFLLTGTTKTEGQRAVSVMAKLGTRRLALIDDGTSFPQTLATATAASVREPGSTTTLVAQLTLIQGGSGYPRIVETVLRERADMVFFTGYYTEAATLIRDLRAAGYPGKIMLSDGGTDPALFALLTPEQAEGVYGLTLPVAQFEPRAKGWAERYKAAYGKDPGPSTLLAYDAVRLALDAIKRAGSLDRAAVRKAIATTTAGDIELLSGTPQFNPDGSRMNPTFILLQIRGGTFVRQAGMQ
jgi:branched-chain amino acid transport system substrate-binding protein